MLSSSLNELVTTRRTRTELIEALTPKYREVHLDLVLPGDVSQLEASVKSIISLVAHSLKESPVVLIFATRSKGKYRSKRQDRDRRRRISFPFFGKHLTRVQKGAQNVAEILTLLRTIYSRIKEREISTVRDVYYSNVELFRSQERVTHWLDVLALNFKVTSKTHLNIVPAQKGLFYCTEPLAIEIRKQQRFAEFEPCSSQLIPYIDNGGKIKLRGGQISKVIVLEKEAVYGKLIQQLPTGSGKDATLVVTGKGYPDNLTRVFLKNLINSDNNGGGGLLAPGATLDIYTDADPDGINIALIYMLNWPSQIESPPLCRYGGITLPRLIQIRVQLMDLTQRDISLLKGLIVKCQTAATTTTTTDRTQGEEHPLRGVMLQLQRQMFFGKKGEMNAVYSKGKGEREDRRDNSLLSCPV